MERSKELSMDQAFLQSVAHAIYKNLSNEHFSADDLAREVGLSRSQIHRKLHKINGKPISQFIREIRLQEARRYLEDNSGTVSEIAYSVGFSSPAYFTKCFHEFYGMTPGEVKQQANQDLSLPNASSIVNHIDRPAKKRLHSIRGPIVASSMIATVLLIGFTGWTIQQTVMKRWAKTQALPKIEYLADENNFTEAYRLAVKAEKYIPGNTELITQLSWISSRISIHTDPPEAKIYAKEYELFNSDWKYLGRSPIDSLRLPRNFYRWMIVKEEYDTVMAVVRPREDTLFRKLDKEGTLPAGMVRVNSGKTDDGLIPDFFIDKYEVTNEQFKAFVDAGGYQNKAYWKYPFIRDGVELEFEEAMNLFCDQTGRPGPATWEAGNYLESEDKHPVSGISWYEAAAYTEFAGKQLPTFQHWQLAAGFNILSNRYFHAQIVPQSNFDKEGGIVSGEIKHGMNCYGAFDMAGNVREWCWNESIIGRVILGGAWNDAPYLYTDESHMPPFDRSIKNGFRCVIYTDQTKIPAKVFKPVQPKVYRDYYTEKQPSDEVFQVYKNQFAYDPIDLKAKKEIYDDQAEDYTIERITFNAAYGEERMITYLYLPKNAPPPYQTVIYFPHMGAFFHKSILKSAQFRKETKFIVNNGRAVMYPVYIGTWDRSDAVNIDIARQGHTPGHRELIIKSIKDLKRSIDYLETRPDIDCSRLAYFGISWGAWMGIPIMAVEDRLKTSIQISGGLRSFQKVIPEADPFNFISRVTEPVLLLNGRYDFVFPFEISIKPMYELLGTPEQDKRLKPYDTGHTVPRNEMIKETLSWLDKYLGPVEKKIAAVE